MGSITEPGCGLVPYPSRINTPGRRPWRRCATPLTAVMAALALGACGAGEATGDASKPGAEAQTETVSFALDWTPNTNHIGVYVAEKFGYYRDAGIEPKILPFAASGPEALINNGTADFGISGQPTVSMSRAAGSRMVSVLAVVQKETGSLIAAGDRDDIERPRDLDGKTYGGFGVPWATEAVRHMIRADGGEGKFENATLNTAAYEALEAGRVDFSQDIQTWEGINAELEGKPFKRWQYADYGIPPAHTTVIAANERYLAENEELAKRFVAATQRGYEYAADHPREAAKILIDANPGVFENPELVYRSATVLARDSYLKGPDGEVGVNQPELWDDFGAFLFEKGLLVDADGERVTSEPDWATAYTNDYLSD